MHKLIFERWFGFFHISTMKTGIVLLSTILFFSNANAACVITQPENHSAGDTPGFDGVGAFGELNNTVTLDCLTYVGSIQKNGEIAVLVKDDIGKIHTLHRGGYMGENDGVIVKIDNNAIYIEQSIYQNGGFFKTITVKLTREKK